MSNMFYMRTKGRDERPFTTLISSIKKSVIVSYFIHLHQNRQDQLMTLELFLDRLFPLGFA